jgi:hypothetical protein
MSVALANVNPYIHPSDDILAQLCQGALSLTMTIGLLDMAAVEFQDSYYGPLLVICTTVQMVIGFVVAALKWGLGKFPKTVEKLEGMVSIFCSNPGVENGILEPQRLARSFTMKIKKNAVAPSLSSSVNDTTGKVVSEKASCTMKIKKNGVAPLPASSVNDTTDRVVAEEASWIVEDVSTPRGAISGPKA